ncbi:uncharacterized protein LOC6593743 [Drosophila persimilis]|uniref:uncharacterized protein LOC6593743 n=1 Tax=Drosophila persimilis TaxID=7234 RepID=UPI000F083A88|nr:uncharacterized protein LOC6593743 [Drosophila persimilis]
MVSTNKIIGAPEMYDLGPCLDRYEPTPAACRCHYRPAVGQVPSPNIRAPIKNSRRKMIKKMNGELNENCLTDKQRWFLINQSIIFALGKILGRPADVVSEFLYSLTLQNFSKVLNPVGHPWSTCHVPLSNYDTCDYYMGIFDSQGNLRNPYHPESLKKLIQVMQSVLRERPDADNGAHDALFGDVIMRRRRGKNRAKRAGIGPESAAQDRGQRRIQESNERAQELARNLNRIGTHCDWHEHRERKPPEYGIPCFGTPFGPPNAFGPGAGILTPDRGDPFGLKGSPWGRGGLNGGAFGAGRRLSESFSISFDETLFKGPDGQVLQADQDGSGRGFSRDRRPGSSPRGKELSSLIDGVNKKTKLTKDLGTLIDAVTGLDVEPKQQKDITKSKHLQRRLSDEYNEITNPSNKDLEQDLEKGKGKAKESKKEGKDKANGQQKNGKGKQKESFSKEGKDAADGYSKDGKGAADGYSKDGKGAADGYSKDGKGAADGYSKDGKGKTDGYSKDGKGKTDGYSKDGKVKTDGYSKDGKGKTDAYQKDGKEATGAHQKDGKGKTDAYQKDGKGATGAHQKDGKGPADASQKEGKGATGAYQKDGKGAADASQKEGKDEYNDITNPSNKDKDNLPKGEKVEKGQAKGRQKYGSQDKSKSAKDKAIAKGEFGNPAYPEQTDKNVDKVQTKAHFSSEIRASESKSIGHQRKSQDYKRKTPWPDRDNLDEYSSSDFKEKVKAKKPKTDEGGASKSSKAATKAKEAAAKMPQIIKKKPGKSGKRYYYGEPIPVLVHEPFDKSKSWTWLRRHPKPKRIGPGGNVATSGNIHRYRRSSVEKQMAAAKARVSVHSTYSTYSDTSYGTLPMFGTSVSNRSSNAKPKLKGHSK